MADVIRYGEQAARRTQALSETPEPRGQRHFVLQLLAPRPGESILDIGSAAASSRATPASTCGASRGT